MAKNTKLRNIHWIFLSILMVSAMIYSATTIPESSAQEAPMCSVFIDPPQSVFTDAIAGTTFNVSVSIANVTGLGGLQFNLQWNSSFLICTKITEILWHTATPQESWSNIWSLALKFNNTYDVNNSIALAQYAQTWQDIPTARDGGYAPINVTTPVPACTLTFQVVKVPTDPATYYESNLTLVKEGNDRVKVADLEIPPNDLNRTVTDGYYKVYGPPQTLNHNVVKDSTTYVVTTVSNATVVDGSMTYISNWTLAFNVTGADGATAYVNVTIPKNLVALNLTTDQWNVTVDGTQATPIVSENDTHTFLYITTTLSTKTVKIIGTVPEFPMLMVIPLLMGVTLIAVGLRRRKQI